MGVTMAGMTSAPEVARIVEVLPVPTATAVNRENRVLLNFRTVTEIPAGGGLVIHGPAGFDTQGGSCSLGTSQVSLSSFSSCCFVPATYTSASNETGFVCGKDEGTSGDPFSILVEVRSALEVGPYVVDLTLTNPSISMTASEMGLWSVTSYHTLGVPSSSAVVVDAVGERLGFDTHAQMAAATIVTGSVCQLEIVADCDAEDLLYASGRDDRPSELNYLLISFVLSSSRTITGDERVLVYAPPGFVWERECSVTASEVLGSALPTFYDAWPAEAVLRNCTGLTGGMNNVAKFYVVADGSATFASSGTYVFRIGPVRNAAVTPAPNRWNFVFGEEASQIDGFPPFTFDPVSLVAFSSAVGVAHNIYFHFTPTNTVPVEGNLSIVAPSGFPHRPCVWRSAVSLPRCCRAV